MIFAKSDLRDRSAVLDGEGVEFHIRIMWYIILSKHPDLLVPFASACLEAFHSAAYRDHKD